MPKIRHPRSRLQQLRLYDPFLTPQWRFDRIRTILSSDSRQASRFDDTDVKQFYRFYTKWRETTGNSTARESLLLQYPQEYYAVKMYEAIQDGNTDFQVIIESRLLAGQSPQDIAAAVNTFPGAIAWYASIFFDVQPRLQQTDWIIAQVIMPSIRQAQLAREADDDDDDDVDDIFMRKGRKPVPNIIEQHYDPTLKFFAYFGGQYILDMLLSGFRRDLVPNGFDDLIPWMQKNFAGMMTVKSMQSLMRMPINKYSVKELLSVYSNLLEFQRSTEDSEESRSAMQQHLHAMMAEIPWMVSKRQEDVLEGTLLKQFDDSAVELSADERLLVAAGNKKKKQELLPLLETTYESILTERENFGKKAKSDDK